MLMGVKMCWIQIKMGNPLAQNGASLALFCAIGAHPSNYNVYCILLASAASPLTEILTGARPSQQLREAILEHDVLTSKQVA